MKDKKTTVFISLYNSYPMTSGASTVTTSLFKSWPTIKYLFQISHENPNVTKNIFNYKIRSNNKFIKLFNLPLYIIFICSFLFKRKIDFIIIEGASWVGYIFFFQIFLKFFFNKSKFIYHSHNVESDLRKNQLFISKLTYYFEHKVIKNFDFITAVSKKDQAIFKKKFNARVHLLENGIHIEKKILKKKKIIKNFIIFPGSLEFIENKKIFNELYFNIYPYLKKKNNKNLKIMLTGSNIKFFKSNNDIKELGVLPKNVFLSYLASSFALIIPSKKGPGTKIKIIEALCYDCIVFSSIEAFNGIDKKFQNEIVYKNNHDLFKKIDSLKKNPNNFRKRFKVLGKYYRKKFDMKLIATEFYETIKNK